MNILEIINMIILHLIVFYLVFLPFLQRFSIKIEKSFWENKPVGISIWFWVRPIKSRANKGKRIFVFIWRNAEKIDKKYSALRKNKFTINPLHKNT